MPDRLAWDSAFFGLAIGRVTATRATEDDLAAAVRWAADESIDCLYFLADASDPGSIRAAEAHQFSLVDVRVTLERTVAPTTPAELDSAIRTATPDDVPALTAIARVSHRNTRFHRDGGFDSRRADELYAVWIERAVNGELADATWVVDLGAGPIGYLAATRDPTSSRIGLIGIDASCRGRRYGERLVAAALRWTAERGLPRISVVTQGHEASAMRFYERAGFATRSVQFWYHYWRGGAQGF